MMDLAAKRHIGVWILLGLAFAMRLCFQVWAASQGHALLPDRGAVLREGRLRFLARAIGFAVFLTLAKAA